MPTYSHSKISTFEQCPYKYKLQYIDKIQPELKNTIEAFMGGIVHETLEKFYKDKNLGLSPTREELLNFFETKWKEQFTEDIHFAKEYMTEENYKTIGRRFVVEYYERFKNQKIKVVALETEETMSLPDGNEWHVRIDKLCSDSKGNYYVCDYKTSSRMKSQEEADSDRQLGMYSIWVKDKYKDAKSVKLVWHMLAFNEDVFSERTDEQIDAHRREVIEVIKKINSATEENNFPANPSALCNYCLFQNICPSFSKV